MINNLKLSKDQIEKLTKLMQMTLSDNEPEVVVAVRKANSMLQQLNLRWEDVFKLIPFVQQRVMTHREFADEFNQAFGAAYGVQATVFPFQKMPGSPSGSSGIFPGFKPW